MDEGRLGGEFRALRVAAGRTVASVAVDAGLSVPYIANLENGRGNPTIGALSRLAAALGRRLVVSLADGPSGELAAGSAGGELERQVDNSKKRAAAIPASLVRFARTQRFRGTVAAMAETGRRDGAEMPARVIGALAAAGSVLGRELGEADWGRLLDALFLVAADPGGAE
jgi:transcriptional regulator with XRE-family HTH domain